MSHGDISVEDREVLPTEERSQSFATGDPHRGSNNKAISAAEIC
ncbi:MAG: hypothetical protein AAGB19_01840 [Cyanobacteria bacterium P01_F01_bin.3]